MKLYFAPMEGITDTIYRRIHHEFFGGVDKYFIPFISPTVHMAFTSREQRAVAPEENAGIPVVPQILTKNPEHFLMTAGQLADAGYTQVNLNLGCPSGTVTAKGKGSGMLRNPGELRSFLDVVYASNVIPVSIKTRIGFESTDEWPALLELFRAYPISELIVHPRTKTEVYKGIAHRELVRTVPDTGLSFVYNGDIFTPSDVRNLEEEIPGTQAVMIGRGLVANPALALQIQNGTTLTRERLRSFHDRLYGEYLNQWSLKPTLFHMHEIMYYMHCCFEDSAKAWKEIRKSSTKAAYEDGINRLFETCALKSIPAFDPLQGKK